MTVRVGARDLRAADLRLGKSFKRVSLALFANLLFTSPLSLVSAVVSWYRCLVRSTEQAIAILKELIESFHKQGLGLRSHTISRSLPPTLRSSWEPLINIIC